MSKPLADRVALVTGASRGIGRAAALTLARAGAHVIAVARTVGGLEELDDMIRAEGGSATLTPLDVRDYQGIYRLTPALNERYGKLDILVGNRHRRRTLAARPYRAESLGRHARHQCHRQLASHPGERSAAEALRRGAGRFRLVRRCNSAYAYWAPYSVSKAALDVLARTYGAETSSTAVRVNLFNPGPTRTGMRAMAMPGEDPMKLPTPQQVAAKLVDLCLPTFTETGKIYDFPSGKLQEFRRPA